MSARFPVTTAVAGIGVRQYKRGTAPLPEQGVLVGAIVDACADADIDPADIDGFVSYGDDHNEPTRLMKDLGTKDLCWSSQIWGGGGGGIAGAFGLAAAAIMTGQASTVAVFRALVQGNSGRLSGAVMAHHLNDHLIGTGLVAPALECAMRAQRMMEHDGVPAQCVEDLVRASYYHGSRNPKAVTYGKDLDVEVYRSSRLISEPFHLFDCSRENDGAGVLIMTSADCAKDLKQKPVYLRGVAQGAGKGWGDLCQNEPNYSSAGFESVARRLWAQTGLGPQDIDVVQLYENFAQQGIASLIDHGFCTVETVSEVLRFENLIAPSGKLPVNTGGGNLAQGFIHGIGMAIEAIEQLRGTSSNPVPGARNCLLAGGPGAPLVSSAIFSTDQE
ncbi:transporter [Sphingomonas sp. CGMCC 1.13654]|uniref:Transporter n=1 Tax=Sphingomonas chungangi TaxID=2683589 RepID=A0A838L534_9SPHN|nr:transporter [Sphingomonas chungangi]MBA2933805.1 transporter [Sphingomonas chungangi]MVW55135.1 transporter [Sphingomonas chungangi]